MIPDNSFLVTSPGPLQSNVIVYTALTSLNVDRIDRHALDPGVLHDASNLEGRVVGSQGTNQVKAGIEACSDTTGGDDAHTAQRHGGTPGDGLAAAGIAPSVAALTSNGHPTSVLGRGTVWNFSRAVLPDDVSGCVSK
jgi:hypothetical protein